MGNFQKPDAFLEELRLHLKSLYRPMLGATFTVATDPTLGDTNFFTGRVTFYDGDPPSPRPSLQYPRLTLSEERVEPIEAVLDRLRALVAGDALVDRTRVRGRFLNTNGDRVLHHYRHQEKHTGWPEQVYSVTWDHQSPRLTPDRQPALATGLPPHQSAQAAVAEWVFGIADRSVDSAVHEGEMLVVVPDTRARIVSSTWTGRRSTVHLEVNCPPHEVELQTLFPESRQTRHNAVRSPPSMVEIEVPADARFIWHALVHASNVNLGDITLTEVNRVFDEKADVLPVEQQARLDIASGENDEVEFKPFILPKHIKEQEVLATVVAFANTNGGRIYLGVDDNRRRLGRSDLVGAFPPRREADQKTDFIHWANKLIGDKVKPVPEFSVDLLELDGDPVGCITVKKGTDRPYGTYNNDVYIRKGATNAQPDPATELRTLVQSSSSVRLPKMAAGPFAVSPVDDDLSG